MKKLIILFSILITINAYSQVSSSNPNFTFLQNGGIITTAVPFLLINVDARASGMGDAGVASSPDANAMFWNPAKLAFAEKDIQGSISYTPWLHRLAGDMNLSQLSGHYRLRKEDVIGMYFTYFNYGSITFTDNSGLTIRNFTPQEFVFSTAYARKLSEKMGVSLSIKMAYSDLTGGISNTPGVEVRPGFSAGSDLGWYYKTKLNAMMKQGSLALGASISNIMAKMSYTNNGVEDWVPTNLRVGAAYTLELDLYNKITLMTDFNKLMVPSQPLLDNTGKIVAGQNRNRAFLNGIFTSFGDSPNGFVGELKEINMSNGLEYWYNNIFAARAGFFAEFANPYNNDPKFARQYVTIGVGLRYQVFGLDGSYLIPVTAANNPLADTFRFTLYFSTDKPSNQKTESVVE